MVEGTSERRRRHRREVDEIRESEEVDEVKSAEEIVADAKERQESMGDAERLVRDAIREVRARESREENISQGLEEAIGELREMESRKETTESKIKEALEEIGGSIHDNESELSESMGMGTSTGENNEGKIKPKEVVEDPVNDTEPELRTEIGSKYDDLTDYEIEKRETRRLYETVHDGPPEVRIESMHDVDKYLEDYSEEKERKRFDEQYRHCKVYFEVRDQYEVRREELAEEHNVSHTHIGYWRNDIEPTQIQRLREREEERIIKEWSESRPQISEEKIREFRQSELQERKEVDDGRTGIHKMNEQVVREATSHLRERESIVKEDIMKTAEKLLQPNLGEDVRIRYADIQGELIPEKISEMQKVLQDHHKEIEEAVSKRLGLENSRIRVALVNEKIYTWTPKIRKDELVGAYEDQFYYFKDNREIGHIAGELQKHLGIKGNYHEALKQLNEVTRQLTVGDDGEHSRTIPIGGKVSRLEGKVIRMYLDSTDTRLSDLEGCVTKIAGKSGVGGIRSPKFPEGTDLEREITRLTAIIVSDGSLGPKGYVDYCEGNVERFNQVERNLSAWGDIELKRYYRKDNNAIETSFPTPLGKVLLHQGFRPGDKSISNEKLPLDVERMSVQNQIVYLQELIPEDGNFNEKTGFKWSRTVVIAAGKENTEKYGIKSEINPEHISLLEQEGKTHRATSRKYIHRGALQELSTSENGDVSTTAKELLDIIYNYESNLMNDERKMTENLGIQTNSNFEQIRYSPKTGRVSVYWSTATTGSHEAMKWGITCPPNDVQKRNAVKEWIQNNPRKLMKARKELYHEGLPFDEWWV